MKVKVNYKIYNTVDKSMKSNQLNGILSDNHLVYKDDVITKLDLNKDEINMIRENDEYILKLNFINNKHTNGTYYLKKHNKYLDIDVYTKKLDQNDNINIEYELYIEKELSGKFVYNLKIEKM